MRRLSPQLALVLVMLGATVVVSGEKRTTGLTDGNRYRDASGFTFEKYDNWKFAKVDSEDPAKPRLARCLVMQKNPAYPTEYLGNEDKFNLSMIAVFVDTSEMPLGAYASELAYSKSKRVSRKEMVKEFPMLYEGDFINQETATLDGAEAIVLHFRQDYEIQLYNRQKDQYKLREDALLGDLYVAKRGNSVFVFGLSCERAIYRTVNEEAKKIIMSVDFDPPADTTQGAASGAPGQ